MNTSDNGAENISIHIDNSQVNREAKETAERIAGIGRSAEQTGRQMDEAVDRLTRAAAAQQKYVDELNKQYDEQKKKIADLDSQITEHKELQELNRKEVEQLSKAYEKAKETQGSWTNAAKTLKEQLDNAKDGYKQEQQAIRDLNLEKQKASQQAQQLNQERQKEAQNLKNVTQQLKEQKEQAEKIPTINDAISSTMKTIGKLSAGYLSLKSAKAFVEECANVRGSLEQLQIQLEGLYGETEGSNLFGEIRGMAIDSGIYTTGGLAQAAETMKVYGMQTEETMPLLREFGDIAMGNEQKLASLATAMGRVEMEGKLTSRMLLTLNRAGFNPLEEIARKTGQSMDTLRQRMKNGEITTEQVKEALKSATSEGGKFYKMTDKMSVGIKAEQQRLETMIKGVYAKWGEEHESLILGSIRLKQWVVQNIGTIANTLGVLITTYGAYKAAVIAVNAVEAAQAAGYVTKIRLLRLMAAAQAALNTVMSMNPYVLAATALAGLTASIIAFTHRSTIAADATSDWNAREKEMADAHQQRKEKMNQLLQKIQDETSSEYDRQDALNQLKALLPSVFDKYKTWIELQNHLAEATAAANQELDMQNVINGGSSRYNKDNNKLDLLTKYRDAQSKLFNGKEEQRLKIELIKKYPELFTDDKDIQKSMRANPELFRGVNFKSQGTFQTTWSATNELINKVQENLDKGVNETTKKLGTFFDSQLPKMTIEQIRATHKQLANLVTNFDKGNKPGTRVVKNSKNQYVEEMTPAPNPQKYITYQENGQTVRLTRNEVMRRIRALKGAENEYTNNQGRDYLQEAQNALAEAQKKERNIIKNRKKYRTSEAYEIALADAKREVEDAQAVVTRRSQGKDLDKQDRQSNTQAAKEAREAEKAARQRQKQRERESLQEDNSQQRIAEEEHRYAEERANRAREDAYAVKQAEIDGMDEGEEKMLEQAALNHKKEVEQLEQQRKQLYEQKVEHAKTLWDADPNNKGNGFWTTHKRDPKTGKVSGITDLTTEETAGIDAQAKSEDIRYAKEVQEILKQSLDAMIAYYKEFGTLEEQRYAIAKEYEEKITKATTEGERKSLEAQKERDLATAGANSMAMDIDWSQSFDGIGNVLKDVARETLRKIEDYMTTDEFKKLRPSDQKAYTELRKKLTQETGGDATSPFNFKQWGDIAKQVREYQDSVRILQVKTREHADAVRQLQEHEDRLKNATDDMTRTIETNEVAIAQGRVNVTGEQKEQAEKNKDEKQQNLTKSTEQATNGLNNFASALQQMTSGTLYGFANGVVKLINNLTGKSDKLGDSFMALGGKIGGIIGAILQIIDALGDDPKGRINDFFEKITNTIESILQDLPELIGSIVKDVGTLVGGVIEGIGAMFGADDDWLFGGNARKVEELTDRLTKSNDALKTSIDSLKDSIDKENGVNAITDTQKAIRAQERVNQNTMDILEAQMGYHKHHHSNAAYWNLKREDYSLINDVLAEYARRNPTAKTSTNSVYSLSDIYNLTPEQMNEIRTNLAGIWTKMLEQGKYDKSEYWENYADLAGEIDDLTDSLREKLTGITFDSMHDDFVDKLMDMSNKVGDFTKDVNKQFAKGLLNFAVGTQLDSKMKQWWQNWADTMEQQSGNLTETQIDNMRKEYEAFVSEGMSIRDRVFKITGYDGSEDYSQDSSKSILEGVTQDQVQELNGRATSIQINLDRIAEQIQLDYERNGTMLATTQDIRSIVDDLLDLQYQSIEHLAKIETYTSELPLMNQRLEKIRKSVEHL